MNAERLHAIVKAVKADLATTDTVSLIQQLQNRLQKLVGQPQEPSYQQQVSEIRQKLNEALSVAPSNDFSPVWRQVLEEIGAQEYLGMELKATIEEIFQYNQITLASANENFLKVSEELTQLNAALDKLLEGFDALGIGAEDLSPGECELGVLIPRSAVDNHLSEFGQELEKLEKIFSPFAEIATGSRPTLKIRTISSSDLSVFVELVPQIAACVAVAVERTVAFYKQLLEIRRLRQEMKDQGVSEESLAGVDSHANKHMEKGIGEIIVTLETQFGAHVEKTRKQELRTELRFSLNKIANRIDQGYNIDIRAEPPQNTTEEDGGEDATENADSQHFSLIANAAKELQFINLTSKSILSLTEEENTGKGDKKKGK